MPRCRWPAPSPGPSAADSVGRPDRRGHRAAGGDHGRRLGRPGRAAGRRRPGQRPGRRAAWPSAGPSRLFHNGGMTIGPSPTPTDVFERERPRLIGLAYRMLGTVTDAEDVVQDAWLRWQTVEPDQLERPEAWLTTVTTRVALDHLRSTRRRRETYVGPWLPEPLVSADRAGGRRGAGRLAPSGVPDRPRPARAGGARRVPVGRRVRRALRRHRGHRRQVGGGLSPDRQPGPAAGPATHGRP